VSSASSAALAHGSASAATQLAAAKAAQTSGSDAHQQAGKPTAAPRSASASAPDIRAELRAPSLIPEDVKQAAVLEGKRLRASASASASAPAPEHGARPSIKPSQAKATLAPALPASAASAAEGPRFYALVTKPSRSKAEAQARMVLLSKAAANAIAPRGTRIELLQTQDAWQAIWWPFARRADAERARHLLTVRGVLVEMVEF
jgi:hypothetical protein